MWTRPLLSDGRLKRHMLDKIVVDTPLNEALCNVLLGLLGCVEIRVASCGMPISTNITGVSHEVQYLQAYPSMIIHAYMHTYIYICVCACVCVPLFIQCMHMQNMYICMYFTHMHHVYMCTCMYM